MSNPQRNEANSSPYKWKDAKRAAFLLSDLRPRDANPDGYDDKVNFWSRSILSWSASDGRCVFTLRAVREAFANNASLPSLSCLQTVTGTLLGQRKLKIRSELESDLTARVRNSWVAAGINLVSWGLSALSGSPSTPVQVGEHDELVNLDSLEASSKKLLCSNAGKIVRYEDLSTSLSVYSKSTLDLILLNLQAQGMLAVKSTASAKLLKFGSNAVISDVEIGQFELEYARRILEREISDIQEQVDSLKEEARNVLRCNNRSLASQILRRKKRLEMQMEKKQQQLSNIDALSIQIEHSDSQATVLQSYRSAALILKAVSKDRSGVDQVISDLEEAVDTNNEIQDELSSIWANNPSLALDESALEEELEQMLEQSQAANLVKGNAVNAASGEDTSDEQMDDLLKRLDKLRTPSGDVASEIKGPRKSDARQLANTARPVLQ